MVATAYRWTGEDLEAARRAAGLRQADVARRMGVPRPRVSLLEGSRRVTDTAARRFLVAVAELVAEAAR
jgi:transcriptional regulator with XRE-family HTH domain